MFDLLPPVRAQRSPEESRGVEKSREEFRRVQRSPEEFKGVQKNAEEFRGAQRSSEEGLLGLYQEGVDKVTSECF